MVVTTLFKTLINKRVRIELKTALQITGVLEDIDTFFNFKLKDTEKINIPFLTKNNVFIRGSAIKEIWIDEEYVNVKKLEETTRKALLYKKLIEQ
ncbi:U6 snRNA-associated Sm-like protein LSm2 [Nematocida sp. ERTm5]|nr:U6 snRNA-associated Sm-like protein LSm2 [Nematocida sp. AWRm79]KAI5183740.1 U6 snRNA-associated Sm-like protein LSm2 [Nematocida sp. AWRm78]OAG29162.1 U6 snRNA-associated Sm-like protein LSm2 [Nematocida sp. ERTm5]